MVLVVEVVDEQADVGRRCQMVEPMSKAALLGAFRSLIEVPREERCSHLTLQRSLNEEWFSNTLAWLLNPRG